MNTSISNKEQNDHKGESDTPLKLRLTARAVMRSHHPAAQMQVQWTCACIAQTAQMR